MIFIFAEDNTLIVAGNLSEARRECEGIDVEDGVYNFFDDQGRPLRPTFSTPNTKSKLFGPISVVQSGVFDLEVDTDSKETIHSFLTNKVALESNPHFSCLEEIKEFITKR